jgi:hypothetical protein
VCSGVWGDDRSHIQHTPYIYIDIHTYKHIKKRGSMRGLSTDNNAKIESEKIKKN